MFRCLIVRDLRLIASRRTPGCKSWASMPLMSLKSCRYPTIVRSTHKVGIGDFHRVIDRLAGDATLWRMDSPDGLDDKTDQRLIHVERPPASFGTRPACVPAPNRRRRRLQADAEMVAWAPIVGNAQAHKLTQTLELRYVWLHQLSNEAAW